MDSVSELPLFPLPNVLLYPDAILPLHVFEPRYVQLVEDLNEGGLDEIVLGLLAPGWEDRYFDQPPIQTIAGLGQVIRSNVAEQGRYNLLVQGVRRVRIVEELPSERLYRRVRIEEVEEILDGDQAEADALTEALRNELIEFADGSLVLRANATMGYMADLLTVALPLDMERRHELFQNLDVYERARGVLRAIRHVNERRRSLRQAKPGQDPQAHKWN